MRRAQERQSYKVIQWATGGVGAPSLRAIIERNDLELAGVWVSSDTKAGKDAGELCGMPPTGILATTDAASLLTLDADCVSYTATDIDREAEVYDDFCAILAAGFDIVAAAPIPIFHPSTGEPEVISRIRAACEQGQSTLYITGIHPGAASDSIVGAVSSLSGAIDCIHISERLNLGDYDSRWLVAFGFGMTEEEDSQQWRPEMAAYYWGSIRRFLTETYKLAVDDVRVIRKTFLTPDSFSTGSGLKITEGTICGIHIEQHVMVKGELRLRLSNIYRARPENVEGMPEPPGGGGGYLIEVFGTPNLTSGLAFDVEDPLRDDLTATGVKLVNSIPAVCEAPSGFVSSFLDLPPVVGYFR